MMKCQKSKNPCKICLSPVSPKSGVKCDGACGTWVHYSCLNYTPGKIKDIKAGIIKVCCPCPDCKTVLPKEFRVDEPYSCNNAQCPANQPPSCQNVACPINIAQLQECIKQPPCPLSACGTNCKKYSIPQLPPEDGPTCAHPQQEPTYCPTAQMLDVTYLDNMSNTRKCIHDDSSTLDIAGDYSTYRAMEGPVMATYNTMEQMCNTVGELSNKINDLMVQMKQIVNNENMDGGRNYRTNCSQPGPNILCPNPCYCSGNYMQPK